MSQHASSKVLQDKQQGLRQRELALPHRVTQLHKREEIEDSIQQELNTLHQLRRLQQQSHTVIPHLESQIAVTEQQVADLKRQKVALDHWLDEVEETTEESLQQERQELATLILILYPEEESAYHTLTHRLANIDTVHQRLHTLIELADDIARYLSRAVAEGESVRRGGFLRYIAGLNPNLVATACLTGIKTVATQTQQLLLSEEYAIPTEMLPESSRQHIISTLTFLQRKSQEKWRWRTFATEFQAASSQWNTDTEALKQALATASALHQQALTHLDTWLLKNRE